MADIRKSIVELKNRHAGQDVWICAAGSSMNYVDSSFFDNKISIGINQVYRKFRTTYLIRKESLWADSALKTGIPLIVSKHDCGNPGNPLNRVDGPHYVFDHLGHDASLEDAITLDADHLVVSCSTITSAMHAAAFMGASNVILAGHCGGLIDGKLTFDGYYPDAMSEDDFQWYRRWVQQIAPQTVWVRDRLQEVYGCRIYSLNPFANFTLEGHRFSL